MWFRRGKVSSAPPFARRTRSGPSWRLCLLPRSSYRIHDYMYSRGTGLPYLHAFCYDHLFTGLFTGLFTELFIVTFRNALKFPWR